MKFLIIIIIVCYLGGCSKPDVVIKEDLSKFIHNRKEALRGQSDIEINFWQNRLYKDPENYVNLYELGRHYLTLFRKTGEISHLLKGDSLLHQSSLRLAHSDPELLQALAQVAITKHQFRDARRYNIDAKNKKASPFINTLLDFDASMELGDYSKSGFLLKKITNNNSFNYLIRYSKYLDHKGDLEGAIKAQESAFNMIKSGNDKELYTWALSQLGDMYGHAGQIKDAYKCYLQVLDKDPNYVHALKGIAWIAFAYDNNPGLAKKIIAVIKEINRSPDYDLLLAEIAEHEGNEKLKEFYTGRFINTVMKKEYNSMYHSHLVELFCEQGKWIQALKLAETETAYRPTPETYSLLAWTYYKMGNVKEAIRIYYNHIIGKSFEPEINFRSAFIALAAGKKAEAKDLFTECMESNFELGPVKTKEVQQVLTKL